MVKWLVSRRSVLLAGLATVISALPAFAAKAPTLTLASPVSGGVFQFTLKSSVAIKAYVEWGLKSGVYSRKTSLVSVKAGGSTVVKISGLAAGTKIWYRLRYTTGSKTYLALAAQSASLPSGNAPYIFAVQADPHMDENSTEAVYIATLKQIVAAKPSFVMDLGDIFMVDKLADKSEANIRARYELMKGYYQNLNGLPLKIVLGNHDGELGYSSFNTKNYRAEYFPEQTAELSYFAFTENDVLHVALDPFTFTTQNPKADGWQWTLGKTQYDWLKTTLETSTAKFKFVYIHHLLCMDAQSRGGVKIAGFNEWGGANQDGSAGFATNRPGWAMPVHQLLVKNKVSAVFKGHDHLYAKESLDGIIYQTLPQPSHAGDATNSAVQYGYGAAKVVGGSGYLKVTTLDYTANVEFVKFDGTVADSYKITV
jgi:Calcineurin-like phosphoesterase